MDAAKIMSGDSPKRVINIDMCNCIIPNNGGFKIVTENVDATLKVLFDKWPEITNLFTDRTGRALFRVEEYLCDIASKHSRVFNDIGIITVRYPERDVNMQVYFDKNILSLNLDEDCDFSRKGDNVIVVRKMAPFMTRERLDKYYLVINPAIDISEGTSVPAGLDIYTPVTLDKNILNSPITVTNDGVITVVKASRVEAKVPIIADGVDEVVIRGNSILNLFCTEAMQPCIGSVTNTGMSGGRWSPNGKPPKKIIVDGCVVVCNSKEENFALGTYGDDFVPAIELRNGGKLICPEATGERIVTRKAIAPEGSTKISDRMEYEIFKEGMLKEDLIKPEVRAYMDQLPDSMKVFVKYDTPTRNVQEAVRLCSMNSRLDVSLILDSSVRLNNARVATLLKNRDIYSDVEFSLEQNKIKYIVETYTDLANIRNFMSEIKDEELVICLIMAVYDTLGMHMSNYYYAVLYDMIPAYFFRNWVRGSVDGSVRKFIDENVELRRTLGSIVNYLYIDKIIDDLFE